MKNDEQTRDGVGGLDDEPTAIPPNPLDVDAARAAVTTMLNDIRTGARRKVATTFDEDIDLPEGHFLTRGVSGFVAAAERIANEGTPSDITRSILIKSMQSIVAGLACAPSTDGVDR